MKKQKRPTLSTFIFRFDSVVRNSISNLRWLYLHLKAKITNKGFVCNALSGESDYNICINPDLTVSCNCYDINSYGRLGNLNNNTFEEIFSGEVANDFRKKLASGKLPIFDCVCCHEKKLTSKEEAKKAISEYKYPYKGIMVETNGGCNLDCGCGRTLRKLMQYKTPLSKVEIIAQNLKRIGIKHICYYNLGEPFLSNNILCELKEFRSHMPDITFSLSTNGVLLNTPAKYEAALMFDEIVFSIDGCDQQTTVKYQKGSNFELAYSNMKRLVELRNLREQTKPIIIWKYVVFNWNDKKKHLEKTLQLANEAKIDKVCFWGTYWPILGTSWRFLLARYWKKYPQDFRSRVVKIPTF